MIPLIPMQIWVAFKTYQASKIELFSKIFKSFQLLPSLAIFSKQIPQSFLTACKIRHCKSFWFLLLQVAKLYELFINVMLFMTHFTRLKFRLASSLFLFFRCFFYVSLFLLCFNKRVLPSLGFTWTKCRWGSKKAALL